MSEEDRARIGKIAGLMQNLSEDEAEYVKLRLIETVEIKVRE